MAEYLCPGVDCDDYIEVAATWFDDHGCYVGPTCTRCEARWLTQRDERVLAQFALDPFLSGATLKQLYRRGSSRIDGALASRGRRALPPTLAAALRVGSSSPTARLQPFWPRYRADDGELFDEDLFDDERDAESYEPELVAVAGGRRDAPSGRSHVLTVTSSIVA